MSSCGDVRLVAVESSNDLVQVKTEPDSETMASTTDIGCPSSHIKEEASLELGVELEDGEKRIYGCYYCQRDWGSRNALKRCVSNCFNCTIKRSSLGEADLASSVIPGTSGSSTSNKRDSGFFPDKKGTYLTSGPMARSSKSKQCPFCSYSTIYTGNLKQHISAKHCNDKRHSCPLCDYSTVMAAHLRRHIMVKHNIRHSCPHCSYSTAHTGNLKLHIMAKHSNERPFSCPHCDYSAVSAAYLKKHIVIKHTEDRPHLCPYCSYSTTHTGNLKQHIMAKHSNERPHACPHCDYSAVVATHLKQHIMVKHTNDRPHSCPYCSYSTARVQNLNRHIKAKHLT